MPSIGLDNLRPAELKVVAAAVGARSPEGGWLDRRELEAAIRECCSGASSSDDPLSQLPDKALKALLAHRRVPCDDCVERGELQLRVLQTPRGNLVGLPVAILKKMPACRVGDSEHGQGVFATRYIAAGEPVTQYTGIAAVPPGQVPKECYGYAMDSSDPGLLMYGDPREVVKLESCGYMCNDAHSCIFPVGASLDECRDIVARYERAEKTNPANMGFINKKGTMGTTRVVEEGEELCIDYGVRYWLGWHQRHSKSIPLNVFALILTEERFGDDFESSQWKLYICHVARGKFPAVLRGAGPEVQWKCLRDYALSGGR